jgi:hypothetical protein
LASLGEISVLEIISKAKGAFQTHCKLVHGGRVIKQGLALEQRLQQGTTVTVRDLFFNKPVRRKQLLNGRWDCASTPIMAPLPLLVGETMQHALGDLHILTRDAVDMLCMLTA